MTQETYTGLTQLGHHVEPPASPDAATLERVPNPSRGKRRDRDRQPRFR